MFHIFIAFLKLTLLIFLFTNKIGGISLGDEGSCRWHNIDVLFVADSTENIGEENHRLLMNFFVSLLKRVEKGDDETVHISMAQFTPESKFEFMFDSLNARIHQSIKNTPFTPCRREECRSRGTSINSIAATAFSKESGNRISSPDILIIVSTSLYQIPELNPGELLIKPASVTHAFLITIGNFAPSHSGPSKVNLQFAATTSHFGAIDFEALPALISPLCHSVAGLLRDAETAQNATISISTFILIISLIIVTALILFLVFACAVYRYRNESFKLHGKLRKERENFQKVDEYYRSKLREKSAQEKEREKAMVELINESNKIRDHYRDQVTQNQHDLEEEKTARAAERQHQQQQQMPQIIPMPQPYFLPVLQQPGQFPNQQHHGYDQTREDGDYTNRRFGDNIIASPRNPGEIPRGEEQKPDHHRKRETTIQVPPLRRNSSSDYERDELEGTGSNSNSKEFTFDRTNTHLPIDHPARTLPPVDVLLLVDASSSIGNNQFEQVKLFLKDFINDIDIAPGRSKLCVILFAAEPQVFFGFDRFYSNKSIRRAIGKMPYLGGSTFLAKALSFAAGVLYQEQNMKSGRFRKHKFMPTPRHDRLQVMIVVSDGASDDNFDKQATHLHEKMLVKIAAVVTKSFNKDRLLPITRFDGSVFLLDQQQALSIWLWRQQRMWTENFAEYVEKEKSLTNLMESSRQIQPPQSPKKKQKKGQPKPETKRSK